MTDEETTSFDSHVHQQGRRHMFEERPRYHNVTTSNRWEGGLKVDIPEFHGGLAPEEFVDWLATVEEILDFKEVPENKKVGLVATRLRGRAGAWWQQLKQMRLRRGQAKIQSWEKLKKHMKLAFLPHNYARLIYQQLQNLRQGSKSIND